MSAELEGVQMGLVTKRRIGMPTQHGVVVREVWQIRYGLSSVTAEDTMCCNATGVPI